MHPHIDTACLRGIETDELAPSHVEEVSQVVVISVCEPTVILASLFTENDEIGIIILPTVTEI